MKKILIFLLLISSFAYSQKYVSSDSKLVTYQPYTPLDTNDLIQDCSIYNDTSIIDSYGNNINLVESNGFKFNGSDNYINTGEYITGQTPINFKCKFSKAVAADIEPLLGTWNIVANKGIDILAFGSDRFRMRISDGSSYVMLYVTVPAFVALQLYDFELDWSGISGEDITITFDEVEYYVTATLDWSGIPDRAVYIGTYGNTTIKFNGVITNCEYTINNNQSKLIPFSLGSGNKVYDVNSNTEYTILGTVNATNHILQDEYHYNILNGFTDSVGVKYPASKLNLGYNVEGGLLTNPSITNANGDIIGHNNAETKLQQSLIPALIAADTDTFWYDNTGTVAKKVQFEKLTTNRGDYIFQNVQSSTEVRELLFYDTTKTTEEKTEIQNFFDLVKKLFYVKYYY